MTKKLFYVDSCIWLNLFKKESSPHNGQPYWKLAKSFLERILFSEHEIIYSGFVLKELMYKLDNEQIFKEKHEFLKSEVKFRFVKALIEDYEFARKLESKFGFTISFYDCLHIAICKRLKAILVTRDHLLLNAAKEYIQVGKPENLFS